MKKLTFFYFGEVGTYNEYSPAFVSDQPFVPEILYLIASHEPFTLTKENLKGIIEPQYVEHALFHLTRINAIDEKEGRFKLNFPVFLESDLPLLNLHLSDIAKHIGNRIINLKQKLETKLIPLSSYSKFSHQRLLYHIICDKIFDGTAIEFFGEEGIFCISKPQPDNRDYLIIGYEDNPVVEHHSNKLLCSSNNFYTEDYVFNSFGDSNGHRKDVYRFFNLLHKTIKTATPFEEVNQAYQELLQVQNKEIAQQCGDQIFKTTINPITFDTLSLKEQQLANWLISLNYLKLSKKHLICCVPTFNESDQQIIEEISDLILNTIKDDVKQAFEKLQETATSLTSIKHGVKIKEIANELWHQIFGFTNEYLVQVGFVECPPLIEGEGRYLKSFRIKKDIQA